MFITYDYVCTNPECSQHNQIHERMHRKGEEQKCNECSSLLERKPSAPKQAHVSWSTWRI